MKAANVFQTLKAQVGKLRINELFTLVLMYVGLPAIAYIYSGPREAFAAFVIIGIFLGIINARD